MNNVRIGIVGVGNIGSFHLKNILEGKIIGLKLCAVCDTDISVRENLKAQHPEIPVFENHIEMFKANIIDTVLIATPHYFHPEIAIDAFKYSLNVLSEKPAGVYSKQVKEMNETAKSSGKLFGIMFNQRTNPLYKKAKEIIENNELGVPKRLVWTITNWYRTQYYYNSGGWRGSYGGEGGGVLINQAPHNLDLMQWIFGMPKTVTAFLGIGKYHNISVEDEANLFLTYENGATATFLTSTGEPVGTNRLEITGDKGKIVIEDKTLKWWKLQENERDFCFTKDVGFYNAPFDYEEIKQEENETAHCGILQNFTNAILKGDKLISPGYDGINELLISNAAYLSHWAGKTVSIPFNEDEYLSILKTKSEDYTYKKPTKKNSSDDPSARWQVRW